MAFPPLQQIAGTNNSIYEAYFSQADATSCGSIGALDAAKFLKKSGLKDTTLSQIWDKADPSGKGYLEKSGFYVALKLIALAQNGLELDPSKLAADINAPDLGPVPLTETPTEETWAIKATEKGNYDKVFDSLGPVNNLLSGDKVRPVLVNSKLAVDVLGRVWDLSDIDKDGFLDRDEFAVAMHLVYRALENDPVPNTLPTIMIPPSKRRKQSLAGAVQVLPRLPMPGSVPVLPTLPPPPTKDDTTAATTLSQSSNVPWVVTASAKSGCDVMFTKADTDNDGFVTGGDVRDLMFQSGLDQNMLAHIWTLCDGKNTGKLNNEQFALAMYLIQQKISGIDPPTQLAPEMVPPSQRAATTGANPTAFGILDSTNAGPHSNAADFSSMKHLDMITQEIEDMKKEKMEFESDSIQRDADLRIRQGDMQTLQKELDAITSTLKQLETQKQDAQKRLDELDDKKSKLESNVKEMSEKCENEQQEIANLESQLLDQTTSVQMKEKEVTSLREELGTLRDEESRLEQLVEAGKSQLDGLAKSHDSTPAEIAQVRQRLEQAETTPPPSSTVTMNGDISMFANDIFTSKAQPKSTPIPELTKPTTNNFHDPFSQSDPFSGSADISLGDLDPFHNEDPFKGSDPFEGNDNFSFPSSGDPFTDAFSSNTTAQPQFASDPFGGGADPFASAFGSTTTKTTSPDPFAPVASSHKPKNPQISGADIFGSDPFDPNAPKKKTKESPRPSLPPKKKAAPPRPAPPRPKSGPVSNSPAPDPFAGSGFTSDPFANTDPFASTDAKSDNFAQFSPSKFSQEDTQLAWAMADSSRLERERQSMRQQEKSDFEFALALSKTDNAESFA